MPPNNHLIDSSIKPRPNRFAKSASSARFKRKKQCKHNYAYTTYA
jgi:hypothetical protein